MKVQCSNLTKKYYTKTAVDHINVTFSEGHIYALLGPNGSGKSTLMKMISGLTSPSDGEISFDGEKQTWRSKADVAYAPTESFFFNYMSIKDVGNYYEDFFEDFDREIFLKLLQEMALSEDLKIKNLSSGMLAKMKIAVTLSRRAKMILLDEPLNGIDLMSRDTIIKTIIGYAPENGCVVISSHMVEELEKTVDYAIFMRDGSIVFETDVEQLREKERKSIVDKYREIYSWEVA
ncbi:MAG: ABC transporter ATP-binding protein [Lachnospiraceae bacterium]|nr:ABC transporter ATP-binding protein [Lachnospiraceae bacterium]